MDKKMYEIGKKISEKRLKNINISIHKIQSTMELYNWLKLAIYFL